MYTDFKQNKGHRLLNLYERLNRGERISKLTLANDYNVSEKTIQRDIDDLRIYLADTHTYEMDTRIEFDKKKNTYALLRPGREWLTNEEVLTICKILLESRALNKDELNQMIRKIMMQVTPTDKGHIEHLLRSELIHYVPLQHNRPLLGSIWTLSEFIKQQEIITIAYKRLDGLLREHNVKPVAILFSEFYFYLVTYMADGTKDFPTTFRVDRITQFQGTGETFSVPYRDRFSEGEFRKRVQFMYAGKLQTVAFTYSGPSLEAVLDRLPTAQVMSESDGKYWIRAEVYGRGIEMWLRSQGEYVTVTT